MAKCDNCGKTILFGGKTEGDLRFCNETCREQGFLKPRMDVVPQDLFEAELKRLH